MMNTQTVSGDEVVADASTLVLVDHSRNRARKAVAAAVAILLAAGIIDAIMLIAATVALR